MALIKEAIPHVALSRDKSVVLTLGITGSGKSTTINYLLKCQMEPDSADNPNPIGYAPAKMGDGVESVTLHPMVYEDRDLGISYVDTPGLLDTRGDEAQVCVSVATEMLVRHAKQIASLMVVIDYNLITTNRGEGLKGLAIILGNLLKNPKKIADSMVFVITKFPIKQKKADLRKKIEEILQAQDIKSAKLQEDFKKLNEEAELGWIDEKAITQGRNTVNDIQRMMMILQLMLNNFDTHLFIVNVFDKGESRLQIAETILKVKPIDKRQFDFGRYDPVRMRFNQFLTNTITEGLRHALKLREIPFQLKRNEMQSAEAKERIDFYNQQIRLLYEQKSQELQQQPIAIENLLVKRRNLIETQKRIEEEAKEQKTECDQNIEQLNLLNKTNPELYWQQSIDEDYSFLSNSIDFITHLLHLHPVAGMAAKAVTFAGKSLVNYLYEGERFYYEGVPFVQTRLEKSSGEFCSEISQPKEGKFFIVYKGDFFGKREASVKIFVEKRLIPDNKCQIDLLSLKIKEEKSRLEELARECHTLDSEFKVLEIVTGKFDKVDFSSLNNSKKELDSLIEKLQEQIEKNQKQHKSLERELTESQSTVDELRPLFIAVRDIVLVLDENPTPLRQEFLNQKLLFSPQAHGLGQAVVSKSKDREEERSTFSYRTEELKQHSPALFHEAMEPIALDTVTTSLSSSATTTT